MNIAFERFADVIDEVLPILRAHWDEVPFGKWPELGFDLAIEQYLAIEEQGYYKAAVMRDEGVIVGYMSVIAADMMHHRGHMQATTDSFYLHPDYRGGDNFYLMCSFVIAECKKLGIDFFSVGVNSNYDFGKALERKGFVPTETFYTWRI